MCFTYGPSHLILIFQNERSLIVVAGDSPASGSRGGTAYIPFL